MRVLFAVEDEKFAQAVIEFAAQHKWPADCEFKILNVAEPLLLSECPGPVLSDINLENVESGKALVKSVAESLRQRLPDVKVDTTVIQEIPKYGILDTAKTWKADLILMGSHGRRGFRRFLLGSVAEAVTGAAPCSVSVIKLPSENEEDGKVESQASAALAKAGK